MTDLLIELTLSNVAISTVLAVLAYAVHRLGRYPALAHLLWVMVLLKLVTPPLFTLDLVPSLVAGADGATGVAGAAGAGGVGGMAGFERSLLGTLDVSAVSAIDAAAASSAGVAAVTDWLVANATTALLTVWAVGSLLVLSTSLLRILRFDRLLRGSAMVAPAEIAYVATLAAEQMGLGSAPRIYMSRANLSPMTWWSAGRVRIVLPTGLTSHMSAEQMRWIIAHELAHVKRRDHLVRWLEWIALATFWWNPIVWFARGRLRLDEEVSCDALVLRHLGGQPRTYAGALLAVVEFLAGRVDRVPAMASALDAGGSLEKRFVLIVSRGPASKAPRWLAASLTSAAILLMTLGIGQAYGGESLSPAVGPSSSVLGLDALAVDDEAAVPAAAEQSDAGIMADGEDPERFSLLSASMAAGPRGGGSWDNVFVGTAAADSYPGSRGRDKVIGKRGADDLAGGGKRDLIRGGQGADTIRGEAGPDRLFGGVGRDTISGGRARDLIRPGPGRDDVDAGPGDDIVLSWRDGVADTIDCGAGDRDRAVVDSTDTAVNCETVVVRDPL